MHVITQLGPGGAERQLQQLAAHATGVVRVICLYDDGLVADALRATGTPVEVLGMNGALARATAHLRLARRLRSLRPDVVNVHLLSAQLWGIPAARLAGVPVTVSTEHSLMDRTIEGRPHRPWLVGVYRLLEAMATHTVAVSDTTATRLRGWGVRAERVSVIANSVDFAAAAFDGAARDGARRSLGLPPGAVVVGAVGRLEAVKRFDVLIDAAAPLLADADAHLVIVGHGSLAGDLATRARRLGVAERVHLVGARPDVTGLLNAFDLFVSPSRDETFGIAVLEAVANGLTTIYGQCPAIDDLGLGPLPGLVPLGGSSDDVGTLRRLLATRLVTGVRHEVPEPVRRRYDSARVAGAYESLYRDLVAASGRRRPWPGPRHRRGDQAGPTHQVPCRPA